MKLDWVSVEYEWDPVKAEANLTKHGIPFEGIGEFDWQNAVIVEDVRYAYGEHRYNAFGEIRGRLHAAVFTTRGQTIRLIGLRKANPREVRRHGKAQA